MTADLSSRVPARSAAPMKVKYSRKPKCSMIRDAENSGFDVAVDNVTPSPCRSLMRSGIPS